jgi:plasmid stability protein
MGKKHHRSRERRRRDLLKQVMQSPETAYMPAPEKAMAEMGGWAIAKGKTYV